MLLLLMMMTMMMMIATNHVDGSQASCTPR
jgi:hypothetical protein